MPPIIYNLSPTNIVEDVQKVFEESQKYNISVTIKNTGHDWKGRSSTPANLERNVILWTHQLKDPEVPIQFEETFTAVNCSTSWETGVFHFGPGETWAGAYNFADQHNRSVVGGTCGSVGIAGWLHGGGHSPLTPVHGMGADNVLQVEMVTPDGKVQIANECQNPDLFFAVRGGGGNTFGIVTNITYKALPKFEVLVRHFISQKISITDWEQDFSANLTNLNVSDVSKLLEIFTSNATTWANHGWGGYINFLPPLNW